MSADNSPKMEAGPSWIQNSVSSSVPSILSLTSVEESGYGNVLHCTSSYIASHLKKVAPSIQCDNTKSSIEYPVKDARRRNALLNKNRRLTLIEGLNQAENLEEFDYDNELKLFPVSIQEKRETRRNAISFVLPKLTWKQKITIMKNLAVQVINRIFHYKLWDAHLKVIEGRRGASIVSYFMFIRWLLFMNLVILLLNLIFVVLPHAASQADPEAYNTRLMTYFENNIKWTSFKQVDINENISGDENGTIEAYNSKSSENPSNKKNHSKRKIIENCSKNYATSLKQDNTTFLESMQNFLQGMGALESSLFFLGHYPLQYVTLFGYYINVPLTFVVLFIIFMVICLIMMMRYSSHGIEEAFVKKKAFLNFANDVLCGWDHCIQEKEAADLHRQCFYMHLKSNLFEFHQMRAILQRTRMTKIKLYLIRFGINVLIIAWIACCYFLIIKTILYQMKKQINLRTSGINTMVLHYLPSIVIMIIRTPSMLMFNFLVSYEKYTSQMTVNISIYRNAFLNLSSIVVVIITLKKNISCEPKDVCGAGTGEDCKAPMCWETYVGQQLYKLAMFQLVFEIPYYLCYTIPQGIIFKKFNNKFTKLLGQPVFLLHFEVLWPIHAQTVLWLGVFHCPLLPIITMSYLFLIFYVQKTIVLNYSALPSVQFKASRFNATFMYILMFSFTMVIISGVYNFQYLVPSPGCGPFRIYDSMIGALSDSLSNLPSFLIFLWKFLTSGWFFIPATVLECAAIYYFWTYIVFLKDYEKKLKTELYIITKDNQFLLNKVNKA